MPAIGGYVYAGTWALVGLLTPWMAYDVLAEGKPFGAVVTLGVGLICTYFMVKAGIDQNRRVNHERARQWDENPLKAAKHRRRRLIAISLFVLGGIVDVLIFGAPISIEITAIVGFLVIASMMSVGMSSVRRVSWWSQIKPTN